ncbi:MAG: hypothetical protein SF029_11255 [bacterium]|nr:hypothetical protein [bacterium]
MDILTREFFDTLIIVVILIGMALAAVRLYRDFTRPLPPEGEDLPAWSDEDTQQNAARKG